MILSNLIICFFVQCLIVLCFVCNFLPYVQSENYSIKFGLKRYFKTRKKRHIIINILLFLTNIILITLCVLEAWLYFIILQLLFVCLLFFNFYYSKNKLKLIATKRVKRFLCLLGFVFIGIYAFELVLFLKDYLCGKYILIFSSTTSVIVSYIVFLSSVLIEKIIAKKFIVKAQKKLRTIKDLKIIGIVGSYAKTSIKVFLQQILSIKYKVCATPKNYNTMLGISKTILENLNESHEILILEIGADRKNDIKKILKAFHVDLAILTGINNQHVEKFGSINNLIKTKSFIVKYSNDANIPIFVNLFNIGLDYFKFMINVSNISHIDNAIYITNTDNIINDNCDKVLTQYCKGIYLNKNINFKNDNVNFILSFDNVNMEFNVRLLHKHSVENLIVAISVSLFLGVGVDAIKMVLKSIKSAENRMEIKTLKSGALLINNSYNSNVNSYKSSLDILRKYEDKNKIVVTPGLIELGKFQFEENFKFGKEIAECGCELIISNKTNANALIRGFSSLSDSYVKIFDSFNKDLSDYINSLDDSYVVLIENDLPDNYV